MPDPTNEPPAVDAPDGPAEASPATGPDLAAELERWKAQARKNEERAKANASAAKELEELRRQHMTDTEKAIAEAASKARSQAIVEVSGQLVRAEVRAAAAGRIDGAALDVLLSALDVSAFVNDDGTVDAKRITEFVAGIAPAPREPAPPGFPDLGQGARGGNSHMALNGDPLLASLKAKLNIT